MLVADEAESSTEIESDEPERDFTDALTDLYQLNLTVVVTEMEGEDIENQFNDALTESEGGNFQVGQSLQVKTRINQTYKL